jgi:transposase-like protein
MSNPKKATLAELQRLFSKYRKEYPNKERQQYPKELKYRAAKVMSRHSVAKLSKALHVSEQSLYRWERRYLSNTEQQVSLPEKSMNFIELSPPEQRVPEESSSRIQVNLGTVETPVTACMNVEQCAGLAKALREGGEAC